MITLEERQSKMINELRTHQYVQIAASQAPRILGLGDRESDSPTYGCFDRNFWHYGLLDVANARYQEVALYLALLFNSEADTPYAGSAIVREWAIASVDSWVRIQNRDGSFDEVYPNERSYVATAFSTFAVADACRRLGHDGANDALQRAARWLTRHENTDVCNQVAGALAALFAVYQVTSDRKWLFAAEIKRDRLLSLQTEEGWFPEYGGWDIGYLSIGLSYLSRYAIQTDNKDALVASERAAKFIADKLRDDGTYDIRDTSRATQYVYPSGLVTMGQKDAIAKHLNGLSTNRVLNPSWMDDRFCIPMAIDYLLAQEARL